MTSRASWLSGALSMACHTHNPVTAMPLALIAGAILSLVPTLGDFPVRAQSPTTADPPAADDAPSDSLPEGVKVERDIPYVENGHPNQILDLYLPEQPSDKPLPLVIWIHGGAWLAGSHDDPVGLFLLNKGFALASIEY